MPTDAAPQTAPEAATDRGERARTRLIAEAARIFAEKGYAAASTREICVAASLNVAAIHYHFGGKEGLYREVLLGPIRHLTGQFDGFDDPALPLDQALRRMLGAFVGVAAGAGAGAAACKAADAQAAQGLRLHLREMVEPSPVYAAAVAQHIVPHHQAMARLLARHVGLDNPDDDTHRLAFALVAMAHDYCMSREFMNILAPRLLDRPDALARALERLVDWGMALVAHERKRHGLQPTPDA
jgi:TetR/AcrR family transcriptional regulator, regulator of cefoperazone and chloramphenicol sensitivity